MNIIKNYSQCQLKPLFLRLIKILPVLSILLTDFSSSFGEEPFKDSSGNSSMSSGGEQATSLPEMVITAPSDTGYTAPNANTATKTDTPVMETPVSIQVVPQQVLQDQKALTLDQALTNVSGVFSGGGEKMQESITLRGFFTTTTFRDGFRNEEYSTTGGGTLGNLAMSNVESVEVLKGPGAILYGRLEPGGMVNVITKTPREEFYAAAEYVYGSWDHTYTAFDITGPLNTDKTFLYRLNASSDESRSWRNNVQNFTNFMAPVLEWRINSGSKIVLSTEFRRENLLADVGQVVPMDPTTNQLYLVVDPAVNAYYNPYRAEQTAIDLKWVQELGKEWSMSLKLVYNNVTSPTDSGYYPNDIFLSGNTWMVDRYLSISESNNTSKAAILDLTGHLETGILKHTLLFGADLYNTNIVFNGGGNYSTFSTTSLSDPTPPYLAPDPTQYDYVEFLNTNYGIYAQDQIKLPANLHLLMGVRYQHFRSITDSELPLGTAKVYSQGTVDSAFTPRAGLLWRPVRWFSLYGSYAEGFGVNNGFDYLGNPLSPEEAKQYEAGAKTEFYDGKLTSSLAWFQLTKTNVAVPDPLHPNYSMTIGGIRSRGIEYDIQGEIRPSWQLVANATWDPTLVTIGGPAGSNYVDGDPLPNDPVYMANIWSVYKFQERFIPGLKVGAGANWRDAPPATTTNPSTPAYWVASAMAAYERKVAGNKFSFQLNVNNLFNASYYYGLYPVASQGYSFLNYGDPRSFMASVKVEL